MQTTNETLSLVNSSPARTTPLGAFLIKKMGTCAKRIEECERQLNELSGAACGVKRCVSSRDPIGGRVLDQLREAEIILDCFLFRFRDIHKQMTGKDL